MNNIDPGDASVDVLALLQDQLEARSKTVVVLESTVLLLIDVVALIGNSLLCFIVYRNPRLLSPTTILILALACTDLLTAATVMPLTIDAVINSRRRFSDGICKAHAFALAVLAQVSIYLMALTAVNRYLCVKKRILFEKIFTKKRTVLYIAGIWFVALLVNGIPNALSLDDFFFCPGYCLCWRRMMDPAAIYSFNAWLYGTFAVSYVVIVFSYVQVFRAVEQHNAVVAANLNQVNGQPSNHREEVSVAKAVGAIILGFTVCWIPSEIMDTMDKINPLLLPRQVFLFATCLWYLSSAINPIIYGVMNSTFRTEYKNFIQPIIRSTIQSTTVSWNVSTTEDGEERQTRTSIYKHMNGI